MQDAVPAPRGHLLGVSRRKRILERDDWHAGQTGGRRSCHRNDDDFDEDRGSGLHPPHLLQQVLVPQVVLHLINR